MLYVSFYSFTSCIYAPSNASLNSAKILAQFIREDPSLRTYADIGLKAFGKKSTVLTGALFCLELFSVRQVSLWWNVRSTCSNRLTALYY